MKMNGKKKSVIPPYRETYRQDGEKESASDKKEGERERERERERESA